MHDSPAGRDGSVSGSDAPGTPAPRAVTPPAAHAAGCDCPRTADLDGDGVAASSRRTFLRGAGALGAGAGAAAAGLLGAQPASASGDRGRPDPYDLTAMVPAPGGRWSPDPQSPRFTVVVMPDTQYLFDQDRIHPVPVEASFRYVLDPAGRAGGPDENVVFLAHLGDVTNNGLAEEYAAATKVFDLLDNAGAAYGVLAGNHDVSADDQRGDTPYLDTFGPARARKSPGYHSSSPDGYNTSHVFRAGGRAWMLLSLDWRLSDQGFAWANAVIAANPTLPVIVTTHEIVGADEDGAASLSDYGQQLWDGLIKDNDQIFLTLNGHYWPPGSTVLKNNAGHDVHLHITNYQDRYYGGAGMIRSYRFDLNRGVIDIATFSPWIRELAAANELNALAAQEIELTSPADYFSVPIDFEQRFAGFAPVAPRKSRPARRMLRARHAGLLAVRRGRRRRRRRGGRHGHQGPGRARQRPAAPDRAGQPGAPAHLDAPTTTPTSRATAASPSSGRAVRSAARTSAPPTTPRSTPRRSPAVTPSRSSSRCPPTGTRGATGGRRCSAAGAPRRRPGRTARRPPPTSPS